MADLNSQLSQLTPEQKQAVMMRAKQEADQQVFTEMMKRMVASCFEKCTDTSGDKLSTREQQCLAMCQDRYLETRSQVQQTLAKRQDQMM